jgi:hypothetical protein
LADLIQFLKKQDILLNGVYSEEYLPWSLFIEIFIAIRERFGLKRGKFYELMHTIKTNVSPLREEVEDFIRITSLQ